MWLRVALFMLMTGPAGPTLHADSPVIDHGTFPSPDGRFTFNVAWSGRRYQFAISDHKTGKVYTTDRSEKFSSEKMNILTPLYFTRWTGDSRTLLTISHIAEGTLAAALYFDGKGWKQTFLEPRFSHHQSDEWHTAVLSQTLGDHTVGLAYLVDIRNGYDGRTIRSSFTFDPRLGYTHVRNTPADDTSIMDVEFR